MNLKDIDVKTFLQEMGVSDTILNNPSFSTMIADIGLTDWIDLRERYYTEMTKDQNGNNTITFHSSNPNLSNYEIVVTPTGTLHTKFSGRTSDSDNKLITYLGSLGVEGKEVVSRYFSSASKYSAKDQTEVLGCNQIEKSYIANGLQMTESEVHGLSFQPGLSNVQVKANLNSYVDDWRIVRRTEIPYICSVYCDGAKGNANGYVNIDIRNPLSMKSELGKSSIDFQLLNRIAEQGINGTHNISSEEKQTMLNSIPVELREQFEKGLMMEVPESYLAPIQIENKSEYQHHM